MYLYIYPTCNTFAKGGDFSPEFTARCAVLPAFVQWQRKTQLPGARKQSLQKTDFVPTVHTQQTLCIRRFPGYKRRLDISCYVRPNQARQGIQLWHPRRQTCLALARIHLMYLMVLGEFLSVWSRPCAQAQGTLRFRKNLFRTTNLGMRMAVWIRKASLWLYSTLTHTKHESKVE